MGVCPHIITKKGLQKISLGRTYKTEDRKRSHVDLKKKKGGDATNRKD